VTGGATGETTGIKEYELTLEIALMLREELQNRGYTVLMTRETHDVNISNKERAEMANQAGADITVRIHGNSYSDSSVNGAETLAPSTSNPYAGDIAENSQKLAHEILKAYCETTGMNNRGVKIDDTMTGINWCEMPVTIIELGFMSNATDDTNMQDDGYQQKMINGIADGIDAYFGL
jgi:N-acetylmuramoyl-L-alanine amidase